MTNIKPVSPLEITRMDSDNSWEWLFRIQCGEEIRLLSVDKKHHPDLDAVMVRARQYIESLLLNNGHRLPEDRRDPYPHWRYGK